MNIRRRASRVVPREIRRVIRRLRFGLGYFSPRLKLLLRWSALQTENDNFYYSLSEKNQRELGHILSVALDLDLQIIKQYMLEIDSDETLLAKIQVHFNSLGLKDAKAGIARRIAWYVITRAKKPRLVVETGVHHGVGALVLLQALKINADEGFIGSYLGIDIDPGAGILVDQDVLTHGSIHIGDSIEALSKIVDPIDILITDSNHTYEHEWLELTVGNDHLSSTGVFLSDNSHSCTALLDFSEIRNRKFLFWREEPEDHWYPGAGIGISLPPNT